MAKAATLNVTQEEAERRYRAANEGRIAHIKKVEFADEFESYSVYGGENVDPLTPDEVEPPVYIAPKPRTPDQDQVLGEDTPEF